MIAKKKKRDRSSPTKLDQDKIGSYGTVSINKKASKKIARKKASRKKKKK